MIGKENVMARDSGVDAFLNGLSIANQYGETARGNMRYAQSLRQREKELARRASEREEDIARTERYRTENLALDKEERNINAIVLRKDTLDFTFQQLYKDALRDRWSAKKWLAMPDKYGNSPVISLDAKERAVAMQDATRAMNELYPGWDRELPVLNARITQYYGMPEVPGEPAKGTDGKTEEERERRLDAAIKRAQEAEAKKAKSKVSGTLWEIFPNEHVGPLMESAWEGTKGYAGAGGALAGGALASGVGQARTQPIGQTIEDVNQGYRDIGQGMSDLGPWRELMRRRLTPSEYENFIIEQPNAPYLDFEAVRNIMEERRRNRKKSAPKTTKTSKLPKNSRMLLRSRTDLPEYA